MSRLFALGCALLLLGCESAIMPERDRTAVYDFRLTVGSDTVVMRWPNASRIRVFVNNDTEPAHMLVLRDAYRHASAAWEAAALFGDFRFMQVSAPERADVILSWVDAELPVTTVACPPVGGLSGTTFCLTEERERLQPFPLHTSTGASNVRFLVLLERSVADSAAVVRRLLGHELGHVLGLAQDSPYEQDLMHHEPTTRDSPAARDRATIQLLYQTRAQVSP